MAAAPVAPVRLLRAPFLRYLGVGGGAWLVDLAAFLMLYPGLALAAAQLIARTSGAAFGFLGYRLFVFRPRSRRVRRQMGAYALLWVASYLISVALLTVLINGLGIAALWSKVIAECLSVLFNYLMLKHLVFRDD